jgi:hypothetical protein
MEIPQNKVALRIFPKILVSRTAYNLGGKGELILNRRLATSPAAALFECWPESPLKCGTREKVTCRRGKTNVFSAAALVSEELRQMA